MYQIYIFHSNNQIIEISRGRGIFSVDITVCKLQTPLQSSGFSMSNVCSRGRENFSVDITICKLQTIHQLYISTNIEV